MIRLRSQLTALVFVSAVGLFGQAADNQIKDPEALKQAIASGQLGAELAARLGKSHRFSAEPPSAKDAPAGLWLVEDEAGQYTVFLDNKHLVLLCADKTGGKAHDFQVEMLEDEKVLHFVYETGTEHKTVQGKYVYGSWKFLPKQAEPAP